MPCFVHSKKGYPSVKSRPRRCGKPILGIVAGSGEDSAEEGQTVCGRQERGRYIAYMPNQPPVLRTEQQNKDEFEELGLGGDMMTVQRRMNPLTLRRAVPSIATKKVRSGMTLGRGVGQWRHGGPSWSHCALPLLCSVWQFP